MKPGVLRGVVPDVLCGLWLVAIAAFKTGSVALAPEAGEPDARFFVEPAVTGPDDTGSEAHVENFANLREVLIHTAIPVVIQTPFAILGAGFLAGAV